MIIDKHVHTQFCPHGSDASMEQYVKVAIEKGIEELTFTEHAPLPINDPMPLKDSAMKEEDVYSYLKEAKGLQAKYNHKIKINVGFEVDFIEGYEEETQLFLEKYPETVEHSILSVHFIKLPDDSYFCIDYSAESFNKKADEVGYQTLYSLYEKSVEKALSLPFGEVTPKKLGHINLIHKFKKSYSFEDSIDWDKLLKTVKANGYKLDYNFAGIDKELYGKTYPAADVVEKAKILGIQMETGSDAHKPEEIGRYFA
jgi:histidinol-phosphatase (PHP family)